MKVFMSRKNFNKKQYKKVATNKYVVPVIRKIDADELLSAVKEFIRDKEYVSVSSIQSKFSIGYPRARKIMQQLIDTFCVYEEIRYKVSRDSFVDVEEFGDK